MSTGVANDRATMERIRHEQGPSMVEYCCLLAQKGLNGGLDGNLSWRVNLGDVKGGGRGDDRSNDSRWGVLSTPSGVRKESLAIGDLVFTDHLGNVLLPGSGPPTSEIAMHLGIYRKRADVQAVIHAHPPYSVALTMAQVDLSVVWLPETVFAIGTVGVAEYRTPTTLATAQAVEELIREHNVVVLPRHGTVAVGVDMEQAYSRTEALEHTSRIIALAMAAAPGLIAPLPPDAVEELFQITSRKSRVEG